MENIKKLVKGLYNKNADEAYTCYKQLLLESEATNVVYQYFDTFADMLQSDNSYIRTRGVLMIAHNAKWDVDFKIDEIIDDYLKHITDYKPIAARQCIQALPTLAKHKPDLRQDILTALHKADLAKYKDSLQPLIVKDIKESINQINNF